MGFRDDYLVHDADEFLFERRIILLVDRPKISSDGIVLKHATKHPLHIGGIAVVACVHLDDFISQRPGPGEKAFSV